MTVRTVRYYDRVGLLNPTARSDSDQRLYSDDDFVRLQQILTLKLIGLSLEAIRDLLTGDAADDLPRLLERQKQALRTQSAQLQRLSDTIERAQAALTASGQPDFDRVIEIIKAVTMHNDKAWLVQFLDEAQQAQMADVPLADQRVAGVAWQRLFSDIRAHMADDVRDPAVQALVERWDALVGSMAQGDAATADGLNRAYAAFDTQPSLEDAPPEVQAWAQSLRDAAAFIERARAAGG